MLFPKGCIGLSNLYLEGFLRFCIVCVLPLPSSLGQSSKANIKIFRLSEPERGQTTLDWTQDVDRAAIISTLRLIMTWSVDACSALSVVRPHYMTWSVDAHDVLLVLNSQQIQQESSLTIPVFWKDIGNHHGRVISAFADGVWIVAHPPLNSLCVKISRPSEPGRSRTDKNRDYCEVVIPYWQYGDHFCTLYPWKPLWAVILSRINPKEAGGLRLGWVLG